MSDLPPHKLRILIVEDDAVFRRGLARVFSAERFDVAQASDGEQAVDLISHCRFTLMICDFRLPGINGLELLRHARCTGQKSAFILVTAYNSEQLMKDARAQGVAAVVEKPIELKRLREQCEEILRRQGSSLMA